MVAAIRLEHIVQIRCIGGLGRGFDRGEARTADRPRRQTDAAIGV
jgi:hypothetical protein